MRAKFLIIAAHFTRCLVQINFVAFIQFQRWMQSDGAWGETSDTKCYASCYLINPQKYDKKWGLDKEIGLRLQSTERKVINAGFWDSENSGRGVVTAAYIQIEQIKMDDSVCVGSTTTLVGVKMDSLTNCFDIKVANKSFFYYLLREIDVLNLTI